MRDWRTRLRVAAGIRLRPSMAIACATRPTFCVHLVVHLSGCAEWIRSNLRRCRTAYPCPGDHQVWPLPSGNRIGHTPPGDLVYWRLLMAIDRRMHARISTRRWRRRRKVVINEQFCLSVKRGTGRSHGERVRELVVQRRAYVPGLRSSDLRRNDGALPHVKQRLQVAYRLLAALRVGVPEVALRVSGILCEGHTMMLPRSMYATQEEDAGRHAGH